MVVAVLSSFNTSLFWFRVDMMRSFLDAGYEVLAVGDGAEEEWAPKFAELGIRYRSIPVQRNGTNPVKDLDTLRALCRLLTEEKPDKIFAYQAKTVIYGGIAAAMNGIREFYPLIAGVGSVFLGSSPKQKLIRSILHRSACVGFGNRTTDIRDGWNSGHNRIRRGMGWTDKESHVQMQLMGIGQR